MGRVWWVGWVVSTTVQGDVSSNCPVVGGLSIGHCVFFYPSGDHGCTGRGQDVVYLHPGERLSVARGLGYPKSVLQGVGVTPQLPLQVPDGQTILRPVKAVEVAG